MDAHGHESKSRMARRSISLRHREPVLVAAMHHPVMEAKCPAQLKSAVDLSEPVIDVEDRDEPAGSVRGERANFTRLVLGCIEVKFCN